MCEKYGVYGVLWRYTHTQIVYACACETVS